MAVTLSGMPFISQSGDRKTGTEMWRDLFKSYFTNGVFNGGLSVTAGSGMAVSVDVGMFHINGVTAFNKSKQTVDIGSISTKTVCYIVGRIDDNVGVRNPQIDVIKGTTEPPTLTRNSTIYEIALARLDIPASTTQITNAMIDNAVKLDTNLCGIVASAVKTLDTDDFYNQIKADLAGFKSTEQEAFTQWFDSIKGQLSTEQAGNLQNQINNIKETYTAKSSVLDDLKSIKAETKSGVPVGAKGLKEYISKNKFTTFETGDILQILELENGYIKIMGKTDSMTLNVDTTSGGYSKEIDLSNYNIDLSKRCYLQCSQEYGAGFDNVSLFLNGNKLRVISRVKTQSYFINWSIEGVVKE